MNEALSAGIDQPGAFPSQRFRQQESWGTLDVERGRMELDELKVGDTSTGLEGDGDAVAGGDRGIRRLAKHLSRAAGGNERPCSLDVFHIPSRQ